MASSTYDHNSMEPLRCSASGRPRPRIFLGPGEVAGYYFNLFTGMRAIGVECDLIEFAPHPFRYNPSGCPSLIVRWLRKCKAARNDANKRSLKRFIFSLLTSCLRKMYFLEAVFTYDAFIFGYGDSLLRNNADLPWLKLFGKRVIMNIGHGSEARPPYIDGYFQRHADGRGPSDEALAANTRKTMQRVRRIEKWADVVVGMPLSNSQFSQRAFINWFCLGIPYQGDDFDSSRCESTSEKVRILHCPSHPVAKGTDRIRQAIEQLRSKGIDVEYTEIIGRPHAEVVEAIKQCDFVVDELFSDTPLAGVGTEAAWHGRPTVVAGYGYSKLPDLVPAQMYPPSFTCRPEEINQAVEVMATNVELRRTLGESAKRFVRTQWSAMAVAKRYMRLVNEDFPSEWYVDPKSICYVHGACQREEATKLNVRRLIASAGISGLQLSHRPDLERAFRQLVGSQGKKAD